MVTYFRSEVVKFIFGGRNSGQRRDEESTNELPLSDANEWQRQPEAKAKLVVVPFLVHRPILSAMLITIVIYCCATQSTISSGCVIPDFPGRTRGSPVWIIGENPSSMNALIKVSRVSKSVIAISNPSPDRTPTPLPFQAPHLFRKVNRASRSRNR